MFSPPSVISTFFDCSDIMWQNQMQWRHVVILLKSPIPLAQTDLFSHTIASKVYQQKKNGLKILKKRFLLLST